MIWSTVTGIVLGVVSSFIFWYIIVHIIVPKIEFKPFILESPSNSTLSGYKYRVLLANKTWRQVIDAEFFVRVRIKGLRPNRPKNWTIVKVPLDDNRIPVLINTIPRYILELQMNKIELDNTFIYPQEFIKKYQEKKITLRDLLELGTDATIQVSGFGYDNLSGTRKLMQSKVYTIQDIRRSKLDRSI